MATGLWRLDPRTVPEAVVIALPGGTEHSYRRGSRLQAPYLRMAEMATSIHLWGRARGIGVWQVRYRYRGWNGDEMSPVDDGLAALEALRREWGTVPAVLLGHSMGGRTALRLAGDPSVRGVVALAPWLPEGEPTSQLAGRRIVLAHGRRDRVVPLSTTIAFAEAAVRMRDAPSVETIVVNGAGHALLRRPVTWDRIVRRSVGRIIGD
jgi:pimeloyl-ACP methyl ester carboxylesterase